MDLHLHRIERDRYGTFGVLLAPGRTPLFSCEPPWVKRDADGGYYPYGKPGESCVPAGRYELVLVRSPKYGLRWHLLGDGVYLEAKNHGRFACLIHSANFPTQLEGCISLGMRQGLVVGRYGVENSVAAVRTFQGWLSAQEDNFLTID